MFPSIRNHLALSHLIYPAPDTMFNHHRPRDSKDQDWLVKWREQKHWDGKDEGISEESQNVHKYSDVMDASVAQLPARDVGRKSGSQNWRKPSQAY